MNVTTVTDIINNSMNKANKVKNRLQLEKIRLSWKEYKKIIEEFLRRCFDNCKLINEYEDKKKIHTMLDFLSEDNFYVRYICKSLEGEILKWQKKYYKVREHKKYSRCMRCGSLIEKTGNKRLYCSECAKISKKESNKNADKKYKAKMRENRKL